VATEKRAQPSVLFGVQVAICPNHTPSGVQFGQITTTAAAAAVTNVLVMSRLKKDARFALTTFILLENT